MYCDHVKCYPCQVVVMRTLISGSMIDTAGRPELVSVWGAHITHMLRVPRGLYLLRVSLWYDHDNMSAFLLHAHL